MAVSLADEITCIEREIGFREKCYPRWVREKKLTQQAADTEMERMRAVLKRLQAARIADVFTSTDGQTEAQVRRDERGKVLAIIQKRNSSVYLRVKDLVERELGT